MGEQPTRVGSLDAIDGQGVSHTLVIYRGPDGATSIVTGNGLPVRRLGPGRYQVVPTDRVLYCDAPDAP